MSRSNRKVPRNRLSQEDINIIKELSLKGVEYKTMAEYIFKRKEGLDMKRLIRQVATHSRQFKRGQVNKWTTEEDNIVINLFSVGVRKESIIAKHLPKKNPWMVRDRIRVLKTKKKLNDFDNDQIEVIETNSFGVKHKNECLNDDLFNFDNLIDKTNSADYEPIIKSEIKITNKTGMNMQDKVDKEYDNYELFFNDFDLVFTNKLDFNQTDYTPSNFEDNK